MNCSPSISDNDIRALAQGCGATACGVARAGLVAGTAARTLEDWIADGCHASMAWMERHAPLRRSTESVMPGARSVIVCAFNCLPAGRRDPSLPRIASYALGRDYHDVVRDRMRQLAALLEARYGGSHRVCVDTAPLSERYWASLAGVGFQGRNCLLQIPGRGSHFVLGELLTTLDISPSEPCDGQCPDGCRRCIDACPGHALRGDGTLDARRCLSYLTIEHRGELPADIDLRRQVYGCDICQRVCPLNAKATPTSIADFEPTQQVAALTIDDILSMDKAAFDDVFGRSALRRAGLDGLRRNAIRILTDK